MKSAAILLISAIFVMAATWAGEPKPDDLTGSILLKDGSAVEFDWTWSSMAGTKLIYSSDISDFEKVADLPKLFLAEVVKIDFLDFSKQEKDIVDSSFHTMKLRKANVAFLDGTIYDNIYLYCSGWKWRNNREEGNVASDKINGLTILPRPVKTCPECKREFREAGYNFCPFDGSPLLESNNK